MAMTKAEKARMEELETALALCWPPYARPSAMTVEEIMAAPQVGTGDTSYARQRTGAAGFFINKHSGEISSGFSDGLYHSRFGGSSWSQTAGEMFRTEREAAMALRIEMSRDFARKLAAVDRAVRGEE